MTAFVLLAAAARAAPPDTLTIAVADWVGSAALYVAGERGDFAASGLAVRLRRVPSGHLALAALLAGEVDLATAAETPIGRAVLADEPLAIVATLATVDRPLLILARRDREVASATDLRGRRIGVTTGTAAEFFLAAFLATRGIAPDEVELVDLPTEAVGPALRAGDAVDAVCTWSPHTQRLQDAMGDSLVVFDDPNLYTMTWNLVARPTLCDEPERLGRLLEAIERGNGYVEANPEAAQDLVAGATGLPVAIVRDSWAACKFRLTLTQSLLVNLEDQARWLLAAQGTPEAAVPNFLDRICAGPLQRVQPAVVEITRP